MRLHLVIGSLERSQARADGTMIQKYHRPVSGLWRSPQVPHGRGRDLNETLFGRQAWVAAFPPVFFSLSYFTSPHLFSLIPATSDNSFKYQCPHLENGNNSIMLLQGLNVLVHPVAEHNEC